jgi:hypothetical protein
MAVIMLMVASSCLGQVRQVPREKWVLHMESGLPTMLCSPGSVIRECFSLSQKECEQGMASATRVCIGNLSSRIPEEISLPIEGQRLGGDVGDCATDAYASTNQKLYTPTQACLAAREEALKAEKALQ